jgi:endonuclease-3
MAQDVTGAKAGGHPELAQAPVRQPARKPRRKVPKGPAPGAPSATPMSPQADYATIRAAFERFAAAEPEPKGELDHVNAFTLVVAVALSAQATDLGVNKATRGLFAVADTPEKMLALGEEGVIGHIKTIGLFRNKARNVIKLSQILVDTYGGEVPSSRAALQSLPGVGRKTANVVLSMWWGHPAQAVDTHIFRVGNRTGLCVGRDVDAVERAIEDQVPVEFQRHAHHWMILHGRYVCKARKPACGVCIIRDLCAFPDKVTGGQEA